MLKWAIVKYHAVPCIRIIGYNVVMGPDQIFRPRLGQVRSCTFRFGKYPLNIPNFSIFVTSGQKNLIRLGQKISGQIQVSPLYIVGGTYVQVG